MIRLSRLLSWEYIIGSCQNNQKINLPLSPSQCVWRFPCRKRVCICLWLVTKFYYHVCFSLCVKQFRIIINVFSFVKYNIITIYIHVRWNSFSFSFFLSLFILKIFFLRCIPAHYQFLLNIIKVYKKKSNVSVHWFSSGIYSAPKRCFCK